jgi:2-desacetyl-2-hydroxyethyl bacteriochlorophyllide A dehydrogenase
MRAALLERFGGGLVLADVEPPRPGPGEVLVRVAAAGLCGSDLHIAVDGWSRTGRLPIILGHEAAGTVALAGPGAERFAPGRRVAVFPEVVCGRCANCLDGRSELCLERELLGIHRDGALAEYVVAPERNLIPLPRRVGFEAGAIATDAVATPYHALVRVGRLRPGERVLLCGMGALGLHAVSLARLAGAARVTAVAHHAAGRFRALERGADRAVDGDGRAAGWGGPFDLAVDFSGDPDLIGRAVGLLRRGGRLVLVGLSTASPALPAVTELVRGGLTVVGSYGAQPQDVREILQLLAAGRLDLGGSVTHRFALPDVALALTHLSRKLGDPVRVVVRPTWRQSRRTALCPVLAAGGDDPAA